MSAISLANTLINPVPLPAPPKNTSLASLKSNHSPKVPSPSPVSPASVLVAAARGTTGRAYGLSIKFLVGASRLIASANHRACLRGKKAVVSVTVPSSPPISL